MKKKHELILLSVFFLILIRGIYSIIGYFLTNIEFNISDYVKNIISVYSLPYIVVACTIVAIKFYKIKFNIKIGSLSYRMLFVILFISVCTCIANISYKFLYNLFITGKVLFFRFRVPNLELFESWLYMLTIVIVGPLVEEILFRRIIFSKLKEYYPVYISIFISSVLFALYHLNAYSFFPLLLAGILFAYIYHLTKSLLLTIICHVLVNLFISLTWLKEVGYEPRIFVLYILFFLGSYLGLFFGIKWLRNRVS